MRRFLFLTLSLVVVLVGCSKEEHQNKQTQIVKEVQVQEETLEVKQATQVAFSTNDTVPVVVGGEVLALLKINWIQKVRVADWKVASAQKNGINYSYAVNLNLSRVTKEEALIEGEVRLENKKGEEIGLPGWIGWSGFDCTATLSSLQESKSVEWIVQPTEKLKKGSNLVLRLKVNGREAEVIKFKVDKLEGVEETGSLIREGEPVIVHTASGGVFSLSIDALHLEKQTVGREEVPIAMFEYTVRHQKKAKEVSKESSLYRNHKLNSQLMFYGTSLGSEKKFESVVKDAEKKLYYNSDKTATYVQTGALLGEGDSTTVHTNLKVNSTALKAKYLRFGFSFSEEVLVQTEEELRHFDGRYLVFEIPATRRTLAYEQ